MKLKVLDLFSGIGGFSLGLERTGGFETTAFCEIEEYPRKVLKKHWPEVPCYHDVTKLTGKDVGAVDVITGGFPCQDLSSAGKSKGIGQGTRSGLFIEMLRLAQECGRSIIIFENVTRILSGPQGDSGLWFYEFLNQLAKIGYDAEWACITAASLGYPHERDRIWIIAYPHEAQLKGGSISQRIHEEHANFSNSCRGEDKSGVVRTLNGVPAQAHRLGCLGNALIPDIPELIGRAILDTLDCNNTPKLV